MRLPISPHRPCGSKAGISCRQGQRVKPFRELVGRTRGCQIPKTSAFPREKTKAVKVARGRTRRQKTSWSATTHEQCSTAT